MGALVFQSKFGLRRGCFSIFQALFYGICVDYIHATGKSPPTRLCTCRTKSTIFSRIGSAQLMCPYWALDFTRVSAHDLSTDALLPFTSPIIVVVVRISATRCRSCVVICSRPVQQVHTFPSEGNSENLHCRLDESVSPPEDADTATSREDQLS